MTRNQSVGRWGEQAAAEFLCQHGYEIAGRNVRTPYGEIDLIARKDGLTIFVEVKARTSKSFGPPEVAVTPRKQAHMLACADHYAQQNEIDHWQIDVIAVEKSKGQIEIVHFENAVS
jgi:putative endonuclease